MKREEDRNKYGSPKETIVKTATMIVFEKINVQYFGLHEIWKTLYLEMRNMLSDRRVFKLTYQK